MSQRPECVIVLHGILRSSKHMASLARFLENQGYRVININYPSTKRDLISLSQETWQQISKQISEEETINFVGYSMGGLLARVIINQHMIKNLGKVIMIGTPNKGSQIADFLKNNRMYREILGPAGQQLTTDQSKSKNILGKVNYELGIIAGSMGVYPLGWLLLKGKNDGRVTVENTKIDGMQDHIIVPRPHFYLPYSKQVQRLTLNFLRYGKFAHLKK